MRLSVLDQSMIVSGRPPADSIRETVELARLCDRLGYHRYWLSEHHNTDSVAGSAPEVLLSGRWPSRPPASAWAPPASCCRTTAA